MSTPFPAELSVLRAELERLTALLGHQPANDVEPMRGARQPLSLARREHLSRIRAGQPRAAIETAAAQQLLLRLWPEDELRGCLDAYIETVAGKIAAATLGDYTDRASWLCEKLGASIPIAALNYVRIERLVRDEGPGHGGLKFVTLRKRIRFLRAALRLQVDRGELSQVWSMPRQLHDDGERGQDLLSVEDYARVRVHIPEGSHRRFFDLGFWTGMHTYDLVRTTREMLDPDYEWRVQGELVRRGAYLRRNHKNRRAVDTWFPMEPELRELVVAWVRENPLWSPHQRVVAEVSGSFQCRMISDACKAVGLAYVSPNRGFRRSFATFIGDRYHDDPEYLRLAMAHEGRMTVSREGGQTTVATHRPTMDTAHYLRSSGERLANAVKRAAR